MTQKEAVAKKYPGAAKDSVRGGIFGCPHNYKEILPIPVELCRESKNGNHKFWPCEECWNQEMKIPTPAEKPMAQVNAFMNQDAEEKPTENAVMHLQHYNRGSIERIDALNAMVEGWDNPVAAVLAWQAVKYIWRHPFKGKPMEDLRKAQFYLERLAQQYEREKAD